MTSDSIDKAKIEGLRDFLAAAAITGILANEQTKPQGMNFDAAYVSRVAYRVADAMMEARK